MSQHNYESKANLEDDGGGAVEHWAVGDVGVSGDPADVGRAPIHVLCRLQVERVLGRRRRVEHVTGLRVNLTDKYGYIP